MSALPPTVPLPDADLAHVRDHTRDVWRECRGAHLFLTGVTGFVGSWLLETALDADRAFDLGLRVTALVRDASVFRARFPHLADDPALSLQVGDVRTFAPPAAPVTHIVHCASAASPRLASERPEDVVALIERGSAQVLELARRARGVRLLQMSSGSVYGPQPAGIARLSEEMATIAQTAATDEPARRFGAAKRHAESCGEAAVADGVGFVSARAFALGGPRLPLDAGFALGNFLGDTLAGRPVTLSSDGTVERSWLYAADLAAWSWTLLVRGRPGRAYNVGSEEAMSLWEAAHRVAALAEPPVTVRRLREPSPGDIPSRYIPATARARAELGLDAWIPFDEAIRRTWGWLRSRPS